MIYEDSIRYAILNGLMFYFRAGAIDVVTMSIKYQQALGGTERILDILTDEQKGQLYLEFSGISIHAETVSEILKKIESLKKHEFANAEAIEIEKKKLNEASGTAAKAISNLAPNLIGMLEEFCTEHVSKEINNGKHPN